MQGGTKGRELVYSLEDSQPPESLLRVPKHFLGPDSALPHPQTDYSNVLHLIGMSYGKDNSSPSGGFSYKRPGHSSPLNLPVSVSTATATPGDFPLRVLLTVAEKRGGYTLSFDAEIPNVLDLNSEAKWREVDDRSYEARLWRSLFQKFPQSLDKSLKQWSKSTPDRKLEDVLTFLDDNRDAIFDNLSGRFLAIGTAEAAVDNFHTIHAQDHRIRGNTFSNNEVRQLDHQAEDYAELLLIPDRRHGQNILIWPRPALPGMCGA